MAEKFKGKWKLCRSEKFDEYMQAMGVGFLMRKAAGALTPTCEIEYDNSNENGESFEIRTVVPLKTHLQKFTVGKQFQDHSPTNDTKSVIVSWGEDDKLVFEDVDQGENAKHVITREVNGEEMIMTCRKGDVVCLRVFKKVS